MTMNISLISNISNAINHLLAQEPWARQQLALHAGKTACIDAELVSIRLQVRPDGLLAPAAADSVANVTNVTIRVRLADLPLLVSNRERAFSYVKLEGDADLANTISQLSQSLRWEAEADLSKLVGDIAATRIVSGAKAALQSAMASSQSLAENVAEYFLEENPMLMRPQSVVEFGGSVSKMRDDAERLIKRIEKLEGRART